MIDPLGEDPVCARCIAPIVGPASFLGGTRVCDLCFSFFTSQQACAGPARADVSVEPPTADCSVMLEADDTDNDGQAMVVDAIVREPSTFLAERAKLLGITPEHLSLLFSLRLPKAIYAILLFLASNQGINQTHDLNSVEYFAGVKSITRGLKAEGMAAASFELLDDRECKDLNGVNGYVCALQLCRRLVPKRSMTWHAPVCSTWVFMNLGTSKRSEHRPYGDTSVKSVQEANCMIWRMVYLILFSFGLSAYYFIEQPSSSLLKHHPAMQILKYVGKRMGHHTNMVSTWLGMFGAPSPKGIKVWSNAPWVKNLKRKLDVHKHFPDTDVFRKYKDSAMSWHCFAYRVSQCGFLFQGCFLNLSREQNRSLSSPDAL